jgi:hypothetical protein
MSQAPSVVQAEVVGVVSVNPTSAPVAGGVLIYAASVALFLAGFAELISGAIVINTSGGYYVGGVYVGIIAMITGIRGCLLKHGSASLTGVLIFSVITGIIAIVGSTLQANYYNFLITLEACATPSSTATTDCNTNTPVYYTCDGDSSAYGAAYVCAKDYSLSNGNSGDQCTCVTTSSLTATCYTYTQFDDCNDLLSIVPHQLQVSYAFAVICVLLCGVIIVLATISLMKPSLLGGTAKQENTSNPQLQETFNPAASAYPNNQF